MGEVYGGMRGVVDSGSCGTSEGRGQYGHGGRGRLSGRVAEVGEEER